MTLSGILSARTGIWRGSSRVGLGRSRSIFSDEMRLVVELDNELRLDEKRSLYCKKVGVDCTQKKMRRVAHV